MYCNHCGKEIPEQAKFCNYCGTQVNIPQPQPAAPVQQPAPVKKKGKAGGLLVTILIALAVYFGVSYAIENGLIPMQDSKPSSSEANTLEEHHALNYITLDCDKGAIYQNGYLSYSKARLHLPGYKLRKGEGEQTDWLISTTKKNYFCVNRNVELGTSHQDTSEEGMLKSVVENSGYTDVSMVEFRKYEVEGYPVIRYIVHCKDDGEAQYASELMIFDKVNSFYSIRICMISKEANGQSEIDQVYDSLQISSEYVLGDEYPAIGVNRITVK